MQLQVVHCTPNSTAHHPNARAQPRIHWGWLCSSGCTQGLERLAEAPLPFPSPLPRAAAGARDTLGWPPEQVGVAATCCNRHGHIATTPHLGQLVAASRVVGYGGEEHLKDDQ